MSPDETILVTGAYGLIGHETVLGLRNRGLSVVAIDLLDTPPPDAAFAAIPLAVEGPEVLAAFLTAHRIGAIVHTAGISGPMLARDRPHEVFRVNAGGTLDLCEAARRAGIRRIVLLSSASAYGETADAIVPETTHLKATSVYGASKIASETIAGAYADNTALELVTLRPCWVYGPRRRTPCVIRTMLVDAIAHRPTRFDWGKDFPRQFVHVRDVAEAIHAALSTADAAGQAFNIADGTRPNLSEIASIVRAILPDADITPADGKAPDDDYVGPLDLSKAARCLDWRPTIGLEDGIRAYAAFLAASLNE